MPNLIKRGPFKYSVFLSYAFDDDEAWYDWITHFDSELSRGLKSRLRELNPPKTFMSGKDFLINGGLDSELRKAIEQSFSMMIFVHDGYLASDWCLKELEYFKQIQGVEGFRSRLFIVAMSKDAIEKLAKKKAWLDHFPEADPIWVNFYRREDDTNVPMAIYSDLKKGSQAVISTEFQNLFTPVREKLVRTAKSAFDFDPDLFRYSPDTERRLQQEAARARQEPFEVVTFIESEPGQEPLWEPLAGQVKHGWDQVVAMLPKEPPFILRPTGLPLHELDTRPRLDGADGVILLWDRKARESLLAQISSVEPLLAARDPAPGLIAYLMKTEDSSEQEVPRKINRWPVARFTIRENDPDSVCVVADDVGVLNSFLTRTLDRKRRLMTSA
jgi:TIR domain